MHYRRNNVKREHSTISGIVPLLEKLTALPFVNAIIPGRIKPINGNYPYPVIQFTTMTDSGIKCLAKSGRATQEVFIISSDVTKIIEYLKELDH